MERTYFFCQAMPDNVAHLVADDGTPEAARSALCRARPYANYGGCWAVTSTNPPDRRRDICPLCLRDARAVNPDFLREDY